MVFTDTGMRSRLLSGLAGDSEPATPYECRQIGVMRVANLDRRCLWLRRRTCTADGRPFSSQTTPSLVWVIPVQIGTPNQRGQAVRAYTAAVLLCLASLGGAAAGAPPMTVYPDDAYSRPLEDRISSLEAGLCFPEGSVFDRVARFSECELRAVREGGRPCVRWRLRPRQDTGVILNVEQGALRHLPQDVSLQVANRSTVPVSVTMLYVEIPWHPGRQAQARQGRMGPAQTLAPGQARRLVGRVADVVWPAGAAAGAPSCPACVRFLFEGLRKDQPYELDLADLVVRYPSAPALRAKRLACPPRVTAGSALAMALQVTGDVRPVPPLWSGQAAGRD